MGEAVRAYIGLGANLGDPVGQIRAGMDMVCRLAGVGNAVMSSLYRTAPVGKTDQPDFVNAVAGFDYQGDALDLLDDLLAIETRLGRVREEKWGPRLLDLDLLIFGNEIIELPKLRVPHPEMRGRAFVLIPLAELAADLLIPGIAKTCGELLDLLPEPEKRAQKVESL